MTGLDDATALRTLTFLAISGGVTLALGWLAFLFPRAGQSVFGRVETFLSATARRKTPAVITLFFAVIVVRVAALPLLPVPVPGIHDEFSYLLMADTFAHGRLANPPHPMWISFETFHVNWLPAYASMYPPAQGFVMAIGQLLGQPWIGVLLSGAAMCAAILWMLQGWLPARWALLGGALAALKLGIASYWINSYWGGAVAAIGGAIVLGALPRIAKHARVRDALLLGLGLAILANSRPYEAAIFCLPVAMWFLWWLAGKTQSRIAVAQRWRNAAVPLAIVLTLTAAFMGYYNHRLTGSALVMPHVLNTRAYHSAPLFLWQRPGPEKTYRNAQFEDFYNGWERDNYHINVADIGRVTWEKIFRSGVTYSWPGLLLVLPALPFALRDRKMRLPLISIALGSVAVFVVIWSNAHYAAPLTAAIFLLIVQTIRHLRTMRIAARPVGLALARALVLALAFDTAAATVHHICDPLIWPCEGDISRQVIAEKLAQTPGKHLIMVRYGPEDEHNIHDEWVYNGAEIDNAKVLWARELDAPQNAKLLAYFRDRSVWLVTPDDDNTYLEPYTPPDAPSSPNR
jgi:hypothetical protein